MKKFKEELVQQVRDGKLAIKNEGCSVEELNILLKHCFPKETTSYGKFMYYFIKKEKNIAFYDVDNKTTIPYLPVSDFYIKEKDIFTLAKEKGFELIMEDMWVWDGDINNVKPLFVIGKFKNRDFPFLSITDGAINGYHKNASKEDPRKKEVLEIGKLAYFWDKENQANIICSKLTEIDYKVGLSYRTTSGSIYKFCSHKNPLENGQEN